MSNNDEQVYAAPESELYDENTMHQDDSSLATRGTRLGAAVLDAVIMLLFLIPGVAIYAMTGGDFGSGDPMDHIVNIYMYSSVFLLIYMIINGYLLYKYGQTMAKRLLNIKIVRNDGERIGFGRLLSLRIILIQVIYQIPVLGFLFMLVNLLFIFREDQRCVHDLIAGTKVINT